MIKRSLSLLILTAAALSLATPMLRAQGGFAPVTGKAFDSAMPKDFYLEGNAIPTEKRNAVLVKTPAGARVLLALIDTTGYSSEIKKKYIGMVIAEGGLSVCGIAVNVGSYGFGLDRPAANSDADAHFNLYNQAGEKAGDCAAKKDTQLKQPRPLQVVVEKGAPARLYVGRYWLELAGR
jgi:hypothetical protein